MTKDEMIEWFKSAPKGSRHERMLWAAHKISRLTGVTEGGTYKSCRGATRSSGIQGLRMKQTVNVGLIRSVV